MHFIRARRRWLINGLTLTAFITLVYWGWAPAHISNPECTLDQNAAWISVDWTSQPADEAAVAELAANASARRFRYLFPFTTYLKADGEFSPSYSHAAEFVRQFRRFNRETYLLAWIGIGLPIRNQRGLGIQGWVNLADQETRRKITSFVAMLVDEAGFDGVHLNIETVLTGDQDYLRLLDEVRQAIGSQRLLSVASNSWIDARLNQLPLINGIKWDDAYYQAVAGRVDQIAVMTYDSFLPHPALYRLWMREQIRGIGKSLEGTEVQLLIGISISREDTTSHRPHVENLQSGLAGVCAGLSVSPAAKQVAQGVAIYAAWEADAADWTTWETWRTGSSTKNR
jgi:hypothetical protein